MPAPHTLQVTFGAIGPRLPYPVLAGARTPPQAMPTLPPPPPPPPLPPRPYAHPTEAPI